MVLASQIAWSESCENALQTISSSSNQKDLEPMLKVLRVVEATLNILADSVLQEQPPVRRRKLEHLVSHNVVLGSLSISFPPLNSTYQFQSVATFGLKYYDLTKKK